MVGRGIKASGIAREELQIASKIWLDKMDHKEARQALERSLDRLQLDYLDMYLIHWPKFRMDDPNWKERNLDVWKMMEDMVDAGKLRSIGLSNFLPHHLDVILEKCRIKPAINQLEIHIGYFQEYAVRYCQDNGILPQAWSPLRRAGSLDDPFLNDLAASYGKTVPQLTWMGEHPDFAPPQASCNRNQ